MRAKSNPKNRVKVTRRKKSSYKGASRPILKRGLKIMDIAVISPTTLINVKQDAFMDEVQATGRKLNKLLNLDTEKLNKAIRSYRDKCK